MKNLSECTKTELQNALNEILLNEKRERRAKSWCQCKGSIKDIKEVFNNYEMGLINPLDVNKCLLDILKINERYYKKIGVTQSDLCNNF